ncbi:hypothetical protein [Klebsiella variicola]|uniref:hypothetical protein n=1 Tax=Klebsiella variicola TaxID=244366 RepID=UPI0013D54BD2|nr:hypothetical protein [Klebsiella variicola]
MTDITELTSVQKNANIHRLSRLIAYASNDELRQMAVEVEIYTDRLIEALEKAKGMEDYWKTQCRGITDHCEELQARIAELESRTVTVKLPDIMPPEAAPAHYWGSGESMAYADGYNKSAADLKTSFALSCSSADVNVEFE